MKDKYVAVWGESDSMFILEPCMYIHRDTREVIGCEPGHFVISCRARKDQAYYLSSDIAKMRDTGKRLLDKTVLDEHVAGCLATEAAFNEFKARFTRVDLGRADNAAITDLIEEYQRHITWLLAYYQITTVPEYLEFAEKRLRAIVTDEEYAILLRSSIDTEVELQEEAMLKLSLAREITDDLIRDHIATFTALAYNTYSEDEMISHMRDDLVKLRAEPATEREAKIAELRKERGRIAAAHREIFSKYASDEVEYLAKMLETLGYWRFRLKNAWAGGEYTFLPLFREIARRLDTDLKTLMWVYSSVDVRNALVLGMPMTSEEQAARKSAYVYVLSDGAIQLLIGDAAERFIQDNLEEDVSGVTELRGAIAQKGYAKGIVRIVDVHDIKQIQKDTERFEEGNILVTSMTQLNVIHLMKKASAILTEQGGITSHAAIISRELKKPCLVGVPNVTRALKDGDLVEVDADAGVVRISERA